MSYYDYKSAYATALNTLTYIDYDVEDQETRLRGQEVFTGHGQRHVPMLEEGKFVPANPLCKISINNQELKHLGDCNNSLDSFCKNKNCIRTWLINVDEEG